MWKKSKEYEDKSTDSHLATDRKHEGHWSNGAENKRIMSLQVLCKSQSQDQDYKEKDGNWHDWEC